MSKILKSFGMAALLVALLAGTGMAVDSGQVTVGGCIRDELAITAGPTTPINFNLMSSAEASTVNKNEDITVEATVDWDLTWVDAEADAKTTAEEVSGIGKMYKGTIGTATYLTNGLTVNSVGAGESVGSGAANIDDCDDEEGTAVDLSYSQTIDASDTTGDYVINIKYVLSKEES